MSRFQDIIEALESAGQLKAAPALASTTDITGVVDDSRFVEPGNLFCAVRGAQLDGHEFLQDAVARGAAVMLVTEPGEVHQPQVVVRDGRVASAIAAGVWYGQPADSLRLLGVTGTNGKTTTVWTLRHLLNGAADAGSIGTLGAFDGSGAPVDHAGLTTPGPVALQATLGQLLARGVRSVVMEVSSHALDQQRVAGLRFAVAVFTNLTHDHLDYHRTFGEYLRAKGRLLEHLAPGGALVVNHDASEWKRLKIPAGIKQVTFGRAAGSTVRADDVVFDQNGTRFSIAFGELSVPVTTPLVGDFNLSNALGAAAAAWAVGESPGRIVERLEHLPQVPGRLERLVTGTTSVFRDYAHTPDALARAIAAVRPLVSGRLLVLFGCGGDRDRRKRAPMGRIAVRSADLAVVTSDNPRTEDPDRIIDEIVEGMEGHAFLRVTDRREAIERAMAMLTDGDGLLLAGKGHEDYQVIGTNKLPFDEREIVEHIATGIGDDLVG